MLNDIIKYILESAAALILVSGFSLLVFTRCRKKRPGSSIFCRFSPAGGPFIAFDDPKRYKGRNLWWMSFQKIESRKAIHEPFGTPPKYKIGDIVILIQKPGRLRKVLDVRWHAYRYRWVYIIDTSASDKGLLFEPYWFADKLRNAIDRNEP